VAQEVTFLRVCAEDLAKYDRIYAEAQSRARDQITTRALIEAHRALYRARMMGRHMSDELVRTLTSSSGALLRALQPTTGIAVGLWKSEDLL
jgi:hypothetical protein